MTGRFALGRQVEVPLFHLARLDPGQEQGWVSYTVGLLVFNGQGVPAVYAQQRLQGGLPLNPRDMAPVSPDSALNTVVSLMTHDAAAPGACNRYMIQVFLNSWINK